MKDAGIHANANTYNTMLSACGKKKDLEAALAFFAEMKEAGIQPDTVTYSALVRACAKAEDLAAAEISQAPLGSEYDSPQCDQ